jgi:hypothetical protein
MLTPVKIFYSLVTRYSVYVASRKRYMASAQVMSSDDELEIVPCWEFVAIDSLSIYLHASLLSQMREFRS